jgi:hypothetical protein
MGDPSTVAPAVSREEQLREIVEGMTTRTLKADKARLLAILDGWA